MDDDADGVAAGEEEGLGVMGAEGNGEGGLADGEVLWRVGLDGVRGFRVGVGGTEMEAARSERSPWRSVTGTALSCGRA